MRRAVLTRGLAACALSLAAGAAPAPAAERGISIVWGGDTTLGSSYGQPPAQGWPQLAPVASQLAAADVAALNLEGTFATGGASKCGGSPGPNCFAFRAPPANARTLARAGVDVVNTANNHAYDFGPAGWSSTRAALRSVGVAATGASGEIRVLRRRGVRIAFVGFSTYRWSAPMSDLVEVRRLVARASRRARIVVAFVHAGAEGADRTHVPYGREHAFGEDRGDSRAFARTAVDAGADLVVGSGPHVVRGVQLYRDRLIAYSLGNLAGWHNFNTSGTSALSALLRVDMTRDGAAIRGTVLPLRLDGVGVPHRDAAGAAAALMHRLSDDDFGRASGWAPRGTAGAPLAGGLPDLPLAG
jgi:poly-gamma-glutamate capsule biosynthesis protein CapA/YwtB (metallophosphatase superfamily)